MMRFVSCLGITLALLCLFSCSPSKSAFHEKTTPHHYAELQQAKDLMESNRPRAKAFLDSLANVDATRSWSEIERQEFLLLRTESHYKNGALNINSPELHPTAAFFDSLALAFPKDKEVLLTQANAYYYLGTEDRQRQRDVDAANDFVTSLKILRSQFRDTKDPAITRFTGLSYFRLGEILISYNIQAGAFDVFEKSKSYFEQVNDTLGIAASIRNIGEVYQSNKDYEKALARFQEANRLWDFGPHLYDHAMGGLFFDHQQMDSACAYLERSFANSWPYARIDASAKLAEIYKMKGDKEKEDYYTMFYVQNSIREANRSSDKMEIEFLIDSLNTQDTPTKSNRWNWGLFAIILAAILIIVILSSIIAHNRHRISHIEKHISDLEQHRKQADDTKQPATPIVKAAPIDLDQAIASYLQSPISQKIHKSVDGKDIMTKSVSLYPNLKLSEVEFIEVVRTANGCFPDFSTGLLQNFRGLSTADVRHCCLALMDLSDAEIAVLEGITYSGANRRTNRILSVMNGNGGLAECVIVYLKSVYT